MLMHKAYKQFIAAEAACLVEILDADGRPFMLMSLEQAFGQGLRHQLTASLLLDRQGRLYLFQRAKQSPFFPELWDIPLAAVQAGEAPLDAALRSIYAELRVRPSHCLPVAVKDGPSPELLVFRAFAPSQIPAPDNPLLEKLLCVGKKEMRMLLRDFPAQLSPLLRAVSEVFLKG